MNAPGISRRGWLAGAAALAACHQAHAQAWSGLPGHFNLIAPGGRVITVTEWRPRGAQTGTIAFSHGAASDPASYDAIIIPWVAAGWRVLAPLHVDSRLHPDTAKYPGLMSWRARLEDMAALSAHIGAAPYVAAGHSYGGLVALTLGGAAAIAPTGYTAPLSDAKVRAVLAFSPPAPIPVLVTAAGYAQLAVPALIETGTRDIMPGMTAPGVDGWKSHLAAYDAAAAGHDRYALVLEGVDHYFGGAICTLTLPGPRQLDRLADANRIAGLFLAAYGGANADARTELDHQVGNSAPVMVLHK